MNSRYKLIKANDNAPADKEGKNDFLDYNYNLYSSTMLLKWVKVQLSPNTSFDVTDDNKTQAHIKILNALKKKLEAIAYLDEYVLDRKERIKDNQDNLNLVDAALILLENRNAINQDNIEKAKQTAYTNRIQDSISYWNGHRLDLVWSRNFIEVMLLASATTLPALSRLLATLALVNGILSYGLYFIRGGLDVTKKVKHTVQEHEFYEENDLTTWERLAVQYKLRYARIINDVVLWGPVNLLTCHLLTGTGLLGNLGNGLTVFLLMGDLYMTTVVKSQSNHNFERLNREMRFLFGIPNDSDNEYLNTLNDDNLSVEQKAEKDLLTSLEHQPRIQNNDHLLHLFDTLRANQMATNEDFDLIIAYQTALVASFSLIFVACLMTPLNMPLLIAGSVGCFLFQYLINLKDMYLRLESETNVHNQHAIYKEMITRVILQTLVPAAIIAAGILVMPLLPTLSVWLVFGMCMTLAATMVTLSENLMSQYRLDAQQANLPTNAPIAPTAAQLAALPDDNARRQAQLMYQLEQKKYDAQFSAYQNGQQSLNEKLMSDLQYSALAITFMAGVCTVAASATFLPIGIALIASSALVTAMLQLPKNNNDAPHNRDEEMNPLPFGNRFYP
jgi:hypothetical protein